MKTIAMYLPQFHRVVENDEWWGEGFTEWTAVKGAKPLFEGHRQPKEPLNDNYYDLIEKETMIWQSQLADRYKVYGFCFYHYWFKDGKKILEKPAENLLLWTDINIRFCFCWANQSWARTWSNLVSKNSWARKFEKVLTKAENDFGILLEQKYGREKEWREHFNYLLPFFKDKRYIKIEGKPVFNIFSPTIISCLEEMLGKWNEWAIEAGFSGLYIIASNSSLEGCRNVDAYLIHEPTYTRSTLGNAMMDDNQYGDEWNRRFSYDKTWSAILNREYRSDRKVYVGGFVNYDDTPRHSVAGTCYSDAAVDKFKYYFEKLVVKNILLKNEFTFLNAWNEWGEGMYLEPDKENGYGYLEAINLVMDKYEDNEVKDIDYRIEGVINIETTQNSMDMEYLKKVLNKNEADLKKYKEYYEILNRWLFLRNQNKYVNEFFTKNELYHIAIYGFGDLGKYLYSELKDSEIKVEYFIDKNLSNINSDIIIKSPNDELPQVDAIIVTPSYDYLNIKRMLEREISYLIIPIKEVIFEI